MSDDFKKQLDSGRLNIRALSVVCPLCGATSKAVLFTSGEKGFTARCPSCRDCIENLNFTLRYYCGFIVPDSNIVIKGLLGKDLGESRFLEDFTIVIPAVIRYECDTKGGRREFQRLGEFASISRIKLKEVGEFDPSKFDKMTTQERDDLIMKACIEENAILLSADNQVKGLAVARHIFSIFVP